MYLNHPFEDFSYFDILIFTGTEMVLGFRLGLVIFIFVIFVYVLISMILGYCLVVKPGKIQWNELILSLLTAVMGPCQVFQEKSKVLLLSSIASICFHILLLISLLVTCQVHAATWNEELSSNQIRFFKHLVYILIPWLLLSLIASWFLEKYSDIDYRFKLSEDLYCDEKKFVHACASGHLAIVKTLIDSGNKKCLNKIDEYGFTGLHYACYCDRLDVLQFLVDQMDDKQMNINVTDYNEDNALVWSIGHEKIAKVLLQSGKLDITEKINKQTNMEGVSDYVKNPDGSIAFKFLGLDCPVSFYYMVKMDSPTVVNSITRLCVY